MNEREFGQQVRSQREAMGMTQVAVAEALRPFGISLHQSAIAKLELGTRVIRLNEALALAGILDIRVQHGDENSDVWWQLGRRHGLAEAKAAVEAIR